VIYFIGDLHLDHENIIRYCDRPFPNADAMNKVLISNWKRAIKDYDIVYFLGDLAFGRHSRSTRYWRKQLTGKVIFIRGSHDRGIGRSKATLKYGQYTFIMVHNPNDIEWTKKDNVWMIHGHTHNHNTNYPFINGDRNTINVSVELTKYKPVSIDFLLGLNLDSIKRMDTISSTPERK